MIGGTAIPLVVNLTVPQIDFLANTAAYLQTAWQAIGVQVNVIPDSSNDIVNNTIANRNYESLLFGNVLGPSSDLYSFWDSSQDFSPGLNLSHLQQSRPWTHSSNAARQNPVGSSTAQELATAQADIAANYPGHLPLLTRLRICEQQERAGYHHQLPHRSLRPFPRDRKLVPEHGPGA